MVSFGAMFSQWYRFQYVNRVDKTMHHVRGLIASINPVYLDFSTIVRMW